MTSTENTPVDLGDRRPSEDRQVSAKPLVLCSFLHEYVVAARKAFGIGW